MDHDLKVAMADHALQLLAASASLKAQIRPELYAYLNQHGPKGQDGTVDNKAKMRAFTIVSEELMDAGLIEKMYYENMPHVEYYGLTTKGMKVAENGYLVYLSEEAKKVHKEHMEYELVETSLKQIKGADRRSKSSLVVSIVATAIALLALLWDVFFGE